MRIVEDFPHEIEETEHQTIPMRDGVRLSARIWRPRGSEEAPVPAILEYIPYRKRFGSRTRDEIMHRWMAGHGYACLRVDLRGSGESEGVLTDEYLQSELDDGVEVLEWIAAQPWCSGAVGMIGISWGGFNGLQIAELQPAPLKAIVTVCSTDDRFADDVHHMGGCLLGDNLSWASVMFSYNTVPPDPALVGEAWRAMWHERLQGSGLWLETWLEHQRRDAYWRHASVNENYDAIRVPVYAVSGWADGYSNAVFRLMANLGVARRGLIGPWSHRYPHQGVPGPAIDFLSDVKRWWDEHLKGETTGIADEPMLRVWLQDSVPPTTSYRERPGRWVAEESWPSPRLRERVFRLEREAHRLGELVPREAETIGRPPVDRAHTQIQSPLTVGLFAGKWCSYASGPDLAHDQRIEDGGALVFDSAPLDAPLEILGSPLLELSVSADKPVAQVAVRLSDVRPDGKATRVTWGILNLTHRDSDAEPEPLPPGEPVHATVKLNGIAQHFPAGHRVRISISTSYWPMAWPPPEPVALRLELADCTLRLPERPPRHEDTALPSLGEPQGAASAPREILETEHHNWLVHRDLAADRSTLEVIDDRGTHFHPDTGLTVTTRARELYSSVADDFQSAKGETEWERELSRDGWHIRTVCRTELTCTVSHFVLHAELDAYEGGHRVFSRNWSRRIPRDLV